LKNWSETSFIPRRVFSSLSLKHSGLLQSPDPLHYSQSSLLDTAIPKTLQMNNSIATNVNQQSYTSHLSPVPIKRRRTGNLTPSQSSNANANATQNSKKFIIKLKVPQPCVSTIRPSQTVQTPKTSTFTQSTPTDPSPRTPSITLTTPQNVVQSLSVPTNQRSQSSTLSNIDLNEDCVISYLPSRYRRVPKERGMEFKEHEILLGVRYIVN
jgi:hypothetical protein